MSENGQNGSSRRVLEISVAVLSVLGSGTGLYNVSVEQERGAFEARLKAVEVQNSEYRAAAMDRMKAYQELLDRVTRMEEQEKMREMHR